MKYVITVVSTTKTVIPMYKIDDLVSVSLLVVETTAVIDLLGLLVISVGDVEFIFLPDSGVWVVCDGEDEFRDDEGSM